MRDIDAAQRTREFEALCRQRGTALTIQRRVIFEAVLRREDHPTADQIYHQIERRLPGVSRTTVYRVLETLAELGVVTRVHLTGTSARYDARTGRHHHLVCTTCNKVVDLDSPELDRLPLPKRKQRQGFEIESYSVQFLGTCAECRSAPADQ